MTPCTTLVLVSDRPGDAEIATDLAKELGLTLIIARSQEQLINSKAPYSQSIVLLDCDHPDAEKEGFSYPVASVCQFLDKLVSVQRMVALTTKPVSRDQGLIKQRELFEGQFQLNLMRTLNPTYRASIARILKVATQEGNFTLKMLFPAESTVETVEIIHSDQRHKATDALTLILQKLGIDQRLSERVSHAADELLMNAIFDAPRDRSGKPTRTFMDRRASFELGLKDKVSFRICVGKDLVGISTEDSFGSVDRAAILKALWKDFRSQNYVPSRYTGPSAGLGLHGIVQAGLSVVVRCEPKQRTETMVLFPRTASYKDFKAAFQFVFCSLPSRVKTG